MSYPEMTKERFWAKVNKNGPIVRPEIGQCWLWSRVNEDGYGKTTVKLKHWSAHRLAWTYENGDIPQELCVCHYCDTRNCVRPSHLWLGTNQENTQDKMNKGRQALLDKIVNSAFENKCHMKLKEDDVILIRQFIKSGFQRRHVAEVFNISVKYIGELMRGRKWGHLVCE